MCANGTVSRFVSDWEDLIENEQECEITRGNVNIGYRLWVMQSIESNVGT